MKKLFIFTILFVLLIVSSLVVTIFIHPTLVINPKNLNYILTKTHVLKSWTWDDAQINHEWIKWNERRFSGHFKNFCFAYDQASFEVKACLDDFSWDSILSGTPKHHSPLKINSSESKLTFKNVHHKGKTQPPTLDVWTYWQMLWSTYLPPLEVKFTNIIIHQNDSELNIDLILSKTPENLSIKTLDFKLWADKSGFEITGPKTYLIPGEHPTTRPLYLREFKIVTKVSKKIIPIEITGLLEVAKFHLTSEIKLPLIDNPSSMAFLKKVILATKGNISVSDIQKNLSRYAPAPIGSLPAPLNAMDGFINITFQAVKTDRLDSVLINIESRVDLKSNTQALKLGLIVNTPINLNNFAPGPILAVIDFEKVLLQLPRISKKNPPPQFFPDPRIQRTNPEVGRSKKEKKSDLTLTLEAFGQNALNLKSDLLDEALRINFKLLIDQGSLKEGFIDILPLKTTVFKRPIEVLSTKIKFQAPLEPTLDARLIFKLPEYVVTMILEGPISKPRYAFSSEPPLPQNDIYAVLLFGRPLADLDPDSKEAASRTNNMLTQGILSLSVLYFLAGSPVEYVGYDPESGQASAQIGLGAKTSLRVGANKGGSTSTGVRRSLGKGWYLDTSVQNAQGPSSSDTKDYGVLLERIIAY